jgi:hypothetical protein
MFTVEKVEWDERGGGEFEDKNRIRGIVWKGIR